MTEEIRLRPLVGTDYQAVVALWRRCDGVELAEGDDEGSFLAYLTRNPGLSHCAEGEGAIVGATLCGHDGRRGLIYHLAVLPEFRGRGVGKSLVDRSLSRLRACGIMRVLILVAADNQPGQKFWTSQGFGAISGAVPLGIDLV